MVVNLKKQKSTKKCVIKKELQFENYESCLKVNQVDNKINHLEKNKIDTDSIKKNRKEFIKNNKSISKIQQRFKTEMYNFFNAEIDKVGLSSNDHKRMQSNNFIETYAYGTSKDLVNEKQGKNVAI